MNFRYTRKVSWDASKYYYWREIMESWESVYALRLGIKFENIFPET